MKILLVCAGGMSSSIIVKTLEKEAEKNGVKLEVTAVGSQEFQEEIKNNYEAAMVAPQIRYLFDHLKKFADEEGVRCEVIQPQGYSPLGGPKLFKQLQDLLAK